MTHPHRIRPQQRADAIDTSPAALGARIEALERDLEKARAETAAARAEAETARTEVETATALAEGYLAALQRERAEFQNYKRRTAEEREASLGLAAEGLISKVLALADDFDRAIDARPEQLAGDPWVEGVSAIDRKLRLLLESEGVSPIDALPGSRFDPREHEAIANVPGTGLPEGSIVEEVRRGYRLRDRVLRPALVAVAGSPGDGQPTDTPGD